MDEITGRWYENLSYNDAKTLLEEKLMNIKRSFISAGYYLKYIRDNELYLEGGYKTIWEFAEDNFGIKRTTASRWMLMNDRFSVDGNTPILAEEYKEFGKSQLQEMLYLEDEQMEQVTPEMTVKEMRNLREELEEALQEEMCDVAQESEEQIPGQMSVEDYPELLPDQIESDSAIDNKEDNVADEQPAPLMENDEDETAMSEVVMDAEYKEVAAENTEIEEMCCTNSSELDEVVYSQIAIRDYLEEEERTLDEYEKVNSEDGGLPHNLMMRQRMLVKALRLLMEHEADQDDQEEDDEPDEIECVQPELQVLKNNDQRKEWLNDYKSWGLWYRDENIDVNYYKYDFCDGSRLVVAEYPHRRKYWNPKEFSDEHYYHLLDKNRKFYGTDKTFEQQYLHSTDSETSLVEFLKDLQKKK